MAVDRPFSAGYLTSTIYPPPGYSPVTYHKSKSSRPTEHCYESRKKTISKVRQSRPDIQILDIPYNEVTGPSEDIATKTYRFCGMPLREGTYIPKGRSQELVNQRPPATKASDSSKMRAGV